MKKLLSTTLFFILVYKIFAEINIGNSIEWLCTDAVIIAKGTLLSFEKQETGTHQWLCTFETVEALKGSSASPLQFFVSNIAEDSLTKYISEKTNLLIFLHENQKRDKKLKTQWVVMETYNSNPALVNLISPQKILISAVDFSVLSSQDIILSKCRTILKSIAMYESGNKTAFLNYLEIPIDTEAFGLLYSGSSCILQVPDFMFPDSRKKL